MNHCSFFGKVKSFAYGKHEDIDHIIINLQIENKRKVKSDLKKIDCECLIFEAWGTAALVLSNLKTGESLLIVDSTARNSTNGVCFRINEFKLMK